MRKESLKNEARDNATKEWARAFCKFLYEVPLNREFTLHDIQGAVGAMPGGIPAEQAYTRHLVVSEAEGWLRSVDNKAGVFRKLGPQPNRSAYAKQQIRILQEKIIDALLEERDSGLKGTE